MLGLQFFFFLRQILTTDAFSGLFKLAINLNIFKPF